MKRKKEYADIEKFAEYKRRYQRKYRNRTGMYRPREWTLHEVDKVMAQDKPDRELSKEIKRSIGAIQTMRCKVRNGTYCGRGTDE